MFRYTRQVLLKGLMNTRFAEKPFASPCLDMKDIRQPMPVGDSAHGKNPGRRVTMSWYDGLV
jgi:hypothetical protein